MPRKDANPARSPSARLHAVRTTLAPAFATILTCGMVGWGRLGQNRAMDTEPPLLTVKEVAERLRVSAAWVRSEAESGGLPAYQVSARWRFDPIELADWLTIRQNDARSAGTVRRRYADRSSRPAPDLEVPSGLDLSKTVTAGEVADGLGVPKERVISWLRSGLVPGYRAGRSWLVDCGVADECKGIVDVAVHLAKLPPGRLRTASVTEAIAGAMLDRRGIDVTVRSYLMSGGPIYWVPGPKSQVRRRREASGVEVNHG